MRRRRIITAEGQEPQETGAEADFGIMRINDTPSFALIALVRRVEMRPEGCGIRLEFGEISLIRPRRGLHMAD